MGPCENPKMSENKKPANVEHSETEEDDGDGGGWHIGFDVQMQGIGVERINGDTTTTG
jgi:hypothetical protein